MKPFRYLIAVLAAAAWCAPGATAEPRHTFNCDAPAGHYSSWQRTVTAGEILISGKITMDAARDDKKWSPIANVLLRHGRDRVGRFGIRFYVDPDKDSRLVVELLKIGGSDTIGDGSLRRSTKQIPFTLRLDASGLLTAVVAGSEASTKLGTFKPDSIDVNCSTGEFTFTDLTVTEKPGPN